MEALASGPMATGAFSRLRAYVALVRVPNCLLIGLAVIVGEAIALGSLPSFEKALFGFLTASLMMAGTMVLNDIFDVNIDRVNSPERPIPSGKVRVREAYFYASLLSAASVASSLPLGLASVSVALLAFGLMVYYNLWGKRTGFLGNVVVSFNVALPFFFGGLSVSSIRSSLSIFSVIAFLSNMGREVAKGIIDVQGDSSHGVRTIAVIKSPRTAAIVSATFFASAVVLSIIAPLLANLSWLYYPPIILADIGFIGSLLLLVSNPKPKTAKTVKKLVLLWMLLGLIGFLLGSLTIPAVSF